MKVYRLNALTIQPKGEKETALLNSLINVVKYEPPNDYTLEHSA
jgi:hypothetical protein